MFEQEIEKNKEELAKIIKNKMGILISSIGSSYIRVILCFELKILVVVDTNENALTELTRVM